MATWMFRGRPDIYDIESAVRNLQVDPWKVTSHAGRIQDGDRVWIYETGKRAGIYCAGRAVGEPRTDVDSEVDVPFWRDLTARDSKVHRVLVRYEVPLVERPILRAELEARGMGGLPAIVSQGGTNYRVPDEASEKLEMLLRSLLATEMLPPEDLSFEEFVRLHGSSQFGIARDAESGHVSVRFEAGGKGPYPDRWVAEGAVLEYTGQGKAEDGDQKWNQFNLCLREAYEGQEAVSVFEKVGSGGRGYRYHGEWFVSRVSEEYLAEEARRIIRFTVGIGRPMRPEVLAPMLVEEGGASDLWEPPSRIKAETYRIIRDTELTRRMKTRYGNQCQVCGVSVAIGEGGYSEAHHVRPLGGGHNGPDVRGNVVVLCPNHHTQFDYGALAIDPATRRLAHSQGRGDWEGKPLAISKHSLDEECLRYAWENVFRGRKTVGAGEAGERRG